MIIIILLVLFLTDYPYSYIRLLERRINYKKGWLHYIWHLGIRYSLDQYAQCFLIKWIQSRCKTCLYDTCLLDGVMLLPMNNTGEYRKAEASEKFQIIFILPLQECGYLRMENRSGVYLCLSLGLWVSVHFHPGKYGLLNVIMINRVYLRGFSQLPGTILST